MRIKDVDIEQGILIVRAGKGDKDRRTVLPECLKDNLIRHIAEIRSLYDSDRKEDMNGVYLPNALEKKISKCRKRMEMVLAVSMKINLCCSAHAYCPAS